MQAEDSAMSITRNDVIWLQKMCIGLVQIYEEIHRQSSLWPANRRSIKRLKDIEKFSFGINVNDAHTNAQYKEQYQKIVDKIGMLLDESLKKEDISDAKKINDNGNHYHSIRILACLYQKACNRAGIQILSPLVNDFKQTYLLSGEKRNYNFFDAKEFEFDLLEREPEEKRDKDEKSGKQTNYLTRGLGEQKSPDIYSLFRKSGIDSDSMFPDEELKKCLKAGRLAGS